MASQKYLAALETQFRSLPLQKQKNFLSHLYSLSKENTDVFEIWLNNGEEQVLERLILQIEKYTIKRMGRFRKLPVSKLNAILTLAKKYPISDMKMIDLKNALWKNTLEFIVHTDYVPNRYIESCVKYVDGYYDSLKAIAEPQERIEREQILKEEIFTYIEKRYYLPALVDWYTEKFSEE